MDAALVAWEGHGQQAAAAVHHLRSQQRVHLPVGAVTGSQKGGRLLVNIFALGRNRLNSAWEGHGQQAAPAVHNMRSHQRAQKSRLCRIGEFTHLWPQAQAALEASCPTLFCLEAGGLSTTAAPGRALSVALLQACGESVEARSAW